MPAILGSAPIKQLEAAVEKRVSAPARPLPRSAVAGTSPAGALLVEEGLVGGALGGVSRTLFGLQSKLFYLSIGGWVLGQLGRIPKIGKPFKFMANVTAMPAEAMAESNVADTAHIVSGTLNKVRTMAGTTKLQGVQESIHGVETTVAGAIFSGAKTISTTIGSVVERGVSKVLGEVPADVLAQGEGSVTVGNWRTRHVAKLFGKANKAADAAFESLNQAADALADPKFAGARSVIERTQDLIEAQGIAGMTPEFATQVNKDLMQSLEGLNDAAKNEFGTAAGEHISNFASQTLRTHSQHAKAQFRGDLKTGISQTPDNVSQMSVMHALNKGIYYTSQAMMAYSTGKIFTGGISTMKHMYASVMGVDVKSVSTFKMLFGKLPDCMKGARSQFLWSAIPQAISNLVGMGAYHVVNNGNGGGFKTNAIGMGLLMGSQQIGGMFAQQKNLLGVYRMIAQAQAQGEKLPMGAYIGLLMHASPSARKAGVQDKKLHDVAAFYAQHHFDAGRIMHEIHTGAFDKRMAEVALTAPATVAAPPAVPRGEQAVLGAHTAAAVARNAARSTAQSKAPGTP